MGKKKEAKSGLGRAMQNAGNQPRTRKQRQERHTIENGMDKGSKLASIIERNDLDEFVANAMLEQREFAAERGSVTILDDGSGLPRKQVVHAEMYDYAQIPVPRRPAWDSSTTRDELEAAEKLAFLNWRRDLALMSQNSDFAVTPYEKNLEVWRQLWRVTERSDLIVQIVDARNPLLFYCRDLEQLAYQLDPNKKHLVIVNKADFLSDTMRDCWSQYFTRNGIQFAFFSAKEAVVLQELEKAQALCAELDNEQHGDFADNSSDEDHVDGSVSDNQDSGSSEAGMHAQHRDEPDHDFASDHCQQEETDVDISNPTAVLNTRQLIRRFLQTYYEHDAYSESLEPITVGLVGYPNVGKSSIINALMGEKKVGVAAMPGKTRHFQTLILNDSITLCDCPGLVFPTFMNSQADLVCNGIVPIDRLRDYLPACNLVARRVHKRQFVNLYGLRFNDMGVMATASELLVEFARVRGLVTGRGLPDEASASRYILKDFTNGRLLYCHPPPDSDEVLFFNSLQYTSSRARPDRPLVSPAPAPDALLLSTLSAPASAQSSAVSAKGGKKTMKLARARMKAHMRAGCDSDSAQKMSSNRPRNVIAVSNY